MIEGAGETPSGNSWRSHALRHLNKPGKPQANLHDLKSVEISCTSGLLDFLIRSHITLCRYVCFSGLGTGRLRGRSNQTERHGNRQVPSRSCVAEAQYYNPQDYQTWIEIQWTHPLWYNRRGHRLDVKNPSMAPRRGRCAGGSCQLPVHHQSGKVIN